MYQYTLSRRLRDYFRKDPSHSTLIITNRGVPLLIYPNHNEFMVCSPSLATCSDFGARYQHGRGYLTHGWSSQRVRRPEYNETIYLWSHEKYRVVNSGQQVHHIYNYDQLSTPVTNIVHILATLRENDNALDVRSLHILQEYDPGSGYNQLLGNLLAAATSPGKNSWTLAKRQVQLITSQFQSEMRGLSLGELYSAGLLKEDQNGDTTITKILAILLVEAIHRERIMSTFISAKGNLTYLS